MKRKVIGFIKLLLLGLLLDGLFCDGFLTFCLDWGVLQSLGVGGLFALCFVRLDNRIRVALGLLLLAIYSQISIYSLPFPAADPFGHGGLIGAFGYGFLSIFGIVSAELFHKNKKALLALGIVFLVLASVVSASIPFNKLEVTASFVLVSIGFCMLFWLLLSRFDAGIPGVLDTISRHSLFLWVLQYILVWYPLGIFNAWDLFHFSFAYGMVFSALLSLLFIGVLLLWKRLLIRRK